MHKPRWCDHGKDVQLEHCVNCRVDLLEAMTREMNQHIKELEAENKDLKNKIKILRAEKEEPKVRFSTDKHGNLTLRRI